MVIGLYLVAHFTVILSDLYDANIYAMNFAYFIFIFVTSECVLAISVGVSEHYFRY